MHRLLFIPALILCLVGSFASRPAQAGEAEIKAAQSAIQGQLEAFKSGNDAKAYDYAAPNIKQAFPTLGAFMAMVTRAYQPVYQPKSYEFGKSEEMSATGVMQQVNLVGADGKSYEAVYTLERQSDGTYLITGVSLRASNALSV